MPDITLWKQSVQPVELNIPFLQALAKRREQTITLFDVETTTFVELPEFGITELALLHVKPDGRLFAMAALVDPEYPIAPEVAEKTGITDAMVAGQPTWAAWADVMNTIAEQQSLIGYNSERFDIPAINSQNARYGFPEIDLHNHGDIYAAICEIQGFRKGKLVEVARRYGVELEGVAHRGLHDTLQLALVADAFIGENGTSKVFGAAPVIAARKGEKQPTQIEMVSEAIVRNGVYDPARISKECDMTIAQVESSADALYRSHAFDGEIFARTTVQAWIDTHLPAAIAACWTSSQTEGRLKPLMEYFQLLGAGSEVTYLQLRIAITRSKRAKLAA